MGVSENRGTLEALGIVKGLWSPYEVSKDDLEKYPYSCSFTGSPGAFRHTL